MAVGATVVSASWTGVGGARVQTFRLSSKTVWPMETVSSRIVSTPDSAAKIHDSASAIANNRACYFAVSNAETYETVCEMLILNRLCKVLVSIPTCVWQSQTAIR
jgi:hypothetical protein